MYYCLSYYGNGYCVLLSAVKRGMVEGMCSSKKNILFLLLLLF